MPTKTPKYPSSPVLCIDASYLLFYRLSALKVWYKHANGEAPTTETINSGEYQQKLCDRIDATVDELVRRHRPSVVVFAYDGHRNWRKACCSHYKGTRQHEPTTLRLFGVGHTHLKTKYCNPEAESLSHTCVVHSEWPLVSEHTPNRWSVGQHDSPKPKRKVLPPKVLSLHHDHLEADDIVHFLTRRVASPQQPVVIVASDHDYLPLLELPHVHLFKLPNTPLELPKHVETAMEYLQLKILTGDNSDNIGPVFQDKPKVTKTVAMKLIRNPELLKERLSASDAATRERYEQNRRLVDNREVPKELQQWMGQWMTALVTAGVLRTPNAPSSEPSQGQHVSPTITITISAGR